MNSKLKHYLLLITGSFSLSLAVVGVFLPLLPTTPFLLLSSYCFYRSSKKMHHWLANHKLLGPYITNYMDHKAIRKKDRIKALVFLWSTLIVSMVIASKLSLLVGLTTIGIAVTIHLTRLDTMD